MFFWQAEISIQSPAGIITTMAHLCGAKPLQAYPLRLKAFVLNLQGYSTVKEFSDHRLMQFWTYNKLPETVWFQHIGSADSVFVEGNNTLWEMGNK